MKRLIPFFTLLCTTAWLSAQITVTNAVFPAVGDTLKTRTNFIPTGITLGAAGSNLTWDFTSLGGNLTNQTIFLDVSAGSVAAEIPIATHVTIDPTTGSENYYRITGDKVEFIAANGNDPTGLGVPALFRFTPPIVERRAPMSFPSLNSSSSDLNITFAFSDLPAILTDSLPLPIAPDSIRVRVVQERNDFVDAWGSLSIPGGTYEVLREKRAQYTETRVDALLPFFGWTDVTDILLSGGTFPGLGLDTSITYNFFSNDAKEQIAVVRMSNDEATVERVDYKNNGFVSPATDVADKVPSVQVSPNPVADVARFELKNFSQGNYRLTLFSLSGNILLEKTIPASGNQTEQLDLSHLPTGSYFFKMTDTSGTAVAVGKLVKN